MGYLDLNHRVSAFVQLGQRIKDLDSASKKELFWKAGNKNSWFTEESCQSALDGISFLISRQNLDTWMKSYSIPEIPNPKSIGILMAGNIPGVGFHDLLCVLLAGHIACVKVSSADEILTRWLINTLIEIEPGFSDLIFIEEMLKGKDAYIATGSDNSARYFNYYFGKYPSIIRANRTSVAVLNGSESTEELKDLGKDIFQYFGLGCRNVSKIFVKNQKQLIRLFDALEAFSYVSNHHKYQNNYEYNKSIYLVNRDPHLDNGFLILKESEELVSPIGVLFYEYYSSEEDLKLRIQQMGQRIQCVVTNPGIIENSISFGQAQCPAPWEYPDQIDTLQFLLGL
jgi:hypothetical protein